MSYKRGREGRETPAELAYCDGWDAAYVEAVRKSVLTVIDHQSADGDVDHVLLQKLRKLVEE